MVTLCVDWLNQQCEYCLRSVAERVDLGNAQAHISKLPFDHISVSLLNEVLFDMKCKGFHKGRGCVNYM